MSGCICWPLPNGEPPVLAEIDCPAHGLLSPEFAPAPDPVRVPQAPSLDQVELSHRILRERCHPLITGEEVHGYSATFDEAHGDLTVAVRVVQAPEEIWGPVPITRCFRVKPDCSVTSYHVNGWPI